MKKKSNVTKKRITIHKELKKERAKKRSKKRKCNEMVRLTISHGVTKAILSGNVKLAFA